MQEASDALSKTADSDTVSTYQVSSVQLVTDKKLEAFNLIKHSLDRHTCGIYTRSTWWKVCQYSAKPYVYQ